ncbi:flavin reductase family protein [Variovorax sp. Sphag1AA]|uniref:flavin reductase family protein n=1 Tax=Variovorax sp. Sphag1AA TaxID=2587027 RepID=UPI00161B9DDB|nr:flavin reductase family protein [Variovorax sp. Sphag1AA]MBB3182448.1 2-nitrobenzoate nitroreductase [Variovorax sp. Sphag1AA]
MKHVSMAHLGNMQKYWLITGSIGPRPIALVTSLGADGLCNAAPFSAFNYMGEEPPLFVIAIDRYGEESHRPRERKDTLINILDRKEFVVNMVDESIAERMARCATDYPARVSEPQAVGLDLAPSKIVRVPRIAEAPISWECELFRTIEFSEHRTLVFGEIVSMAFRDELLDEDRMRVHVDRFAPYGRLGGPNYVRTTDRVQLRVPTFLPSVGAPRE